MGPFLADCHLHFEGCLPLHVVQRLARRAGHPFADPAFFEQRRRSIADGASFLSLYAEICGLFQSPDDLLAAAVELPRALAEGGVRYAEIYVSPEIFSRIGLDASASLLAIAEGLSTGASSGGACCGILLDAVRQWGAEAAERVLDLYERHPLGSIVGFGMGGDESALPAAAFAGAYLRARALGLKTSVHAGEWCGPESIKEALDALRPDRIDHGIAASADRELLERLAEEQTTLWIALSSNVATRAVSRLEDHPLPRLLEAGVHVALCSDDPLLFGTTTAAEYRLARERLGLGSLRLRRLAENGWRAAFCSEQERLKGLAGLESLRFD